MTGYMFERVTLSGSLKIGLFPCSLSVRVPRAFVSVLQQQSFMGFAKGRILYFFWLRVLYFLGGLLVIFALPSISDL